MMVSSTSAHAHAKDKTLARQGLLPKVIASIEPPLCPFSIEARQVRTSISRETNGNSIKSRNLRPGYKILCDHQMSRVPRITYNACGEILKKEQ